MAKMHLEQAHPETPDVSATVCLFAVETVGAAVSSGRESRWLARFWDVRWGEGGEERTWSAPFEQTPGADKRRKGCSAPAGNRVKDDEKMIG
jgi:hypothetical protein